MKKGFLRTISLALCILIIAGLFAAVPTVGAAEVDEAAVAGSSWSTATSYKFGNQVSGSITDSNTKNYYKFTLSSSGEINLIANSYMYRIDYKIYDADYKEVKYWNQYWDSTTGVASTNETVDLVSGTYYFVVARYYNNGSYNFKLNFTSANESFAESQTNLFNDYAKAKSISLNSTYKGQLAENDTVDYYKFTLSSSGEINLIANSYMYRIDYKIYDANYKEVKYWNKYWDSTTEVGSTNETIDLVSGTYYFVVAKYWTYTGNYNFKLNFTSANETFAESQTNLFNDYSKAKSISLNTTYKGQIAENDTVDFYKFTLSSSGKINLIANSYMYRVDYKIYDANYKEVKYWNKYWNDTTGVGALNETVDLSAGTYYFVVAKYYTGNYNFKISSTNYSKHTPGDINNDGKVNLRDVIRLNQYVAGWNVTVNSAATDVNGDGKTNLRDIIRLNQYVAGWNVSIK